MHINQIIIHIIHSVNILNFFGYITEINMENFIILRKSPLKFKVPVKSKFNYNTNLLIILLL